jgi:hypothetical protein
MLVMWQKCKSWIDQKMGPLLRHPLFATAITLLIIVAGLLGSIYANEIRRAFPFYWGPGKISWEAAIFWVLALISALTFFFREQSVVFEEQKLQGRALSQARRFEYLIRTLPPENFLELFGDFFGAANKLVEAAFREPKPSPQPRNVVEQSVRHLLRMIATLAQEFDGDHLNVEYASNIMLFKPSNGMSSEQRVEIRERLLFCDESVAISNLKGVLELQVPLSAIAAEPSASPDPRMSAIALPIPKTAEVEGRFKVFPGAPLAFVSKEADSYGDSRALAAWCMEYGDFTHEVIEQVRSYFATSHIRSFVSIPLFETAADGSDQRDHDPIAVLNIHATRPGLLRGRTEPLGHFVQIMRPFQLFLGQLLKALPLAEISVVSQVVQSPSSQGKETAPFQPPST